ncbi:MAG: hypothetical protein JSW46_02385 [Gemmatimonadota bacterium]|nr:MAG: hypothetical protein JSW46_02385 [Gemmatimonadota bacterium]
MQSPRWIVLLLPVMTFPAGAFPHAWRVGQDSHERVFDALSEIAPRGDRVTTVRDLVLRRDVAEFRLEQGELYLLTPVAGRTVGAVFVGDASVSLTPPLAIERAHMQRVLGDSVLDVPISAVVFVFADSTLAELERRVTFSDRSVDREASKQVNDALDYLIDGKERRVDRTFMSALLNEDANGFFYAYFRPRRGERLIFKVDPYLPEDVLLLRRGRQEGQKLAIVSQFQRADRVGDDPATEEERLAPLGVGAYQIEATIEKNFDFSATATVRVTARRDGVRWARFLLFDELDVDSVVDEGGAPVTYFRGKKSSQLWLRFDPALGNEETRAIRIAYHGDLIERGELIERGVRWQDWAFIKSTAMWFPRYGAGQYAAGQAADMDMTFHTPRKFRFASVGRQVESRVHGDVRTTRWVTQKPTQHASFNIGEFEEFEITDPRIPPVTVHWNVDAHSRLREYVWSELRDPQEQVGGDVANSLAFFTNAFGPPLFDHYYVTEIPYLHGQAFPGLIHLSWLTFQFTQESGANEIFRAHEMAHQWWGIGVEPATYRDAWLSEGFADFAGLWYMQLILWDNEKYFKQLREWREKIRDERDKAPPIGLGTRALEIDPEYYELIVYRKGAWVLHMLRNMMLDFHTMDEGPFKAMLQDFYQTYRGRRASTADFQQVVERHVGLPMGWFFEQWVHGTAIPTYILSWRAEPTPDGQYLLRLRVRQEGVPEEFVMPVPLTIEFPDGGWTVVRQYVRGSVSEAELVLPAEPTSVELNPLESVLAEVKNERWR